MEGSVKYFGVIVTLSLSDVVHNPKCDSFFGIGMGLRHPDVWDVDLWGKNLLGKKLMDVRNSLT